MTTSRGKFLQLEKSLELSPFLTPAKVVLAKVALEDNFGPKILARKGRVSKDLDLEF